MSISWVLIKSAHVHAVVEASPDTNMEQEHGRSMGSTTLSGSYVTSLALSLSYLQTLASLHALRIGDIKSWPIYIAQTI